MKYLTRSTLITIVSLILASGCAHTGNLQLEVFVSEPEEVNVTSALIIGPSEMMVVSAQGTKSAAIRLADRIEALGRSLKYVYLTHPHLDHSQGASVLLKRFPDAQFIAIPEVAERQRESIASHDDLARFRYGANAAVPSVPAEDYAAPAIMIDGHVVEIWKGIVGDGGPNDPHTALYVPSLNAFMPSDAIYFDGHVMLAGSTAQTRAAAVDQIDQWIERDFDTVVPGHMPKGSALTALDALTHTKNYIQTYDQAMADSADSEEVIAKMFAAFPDLQHQSALYLSTYINFGQMDRARAYLVRWQQENPQPLPE